MATIMGGGTHSNTIGDSQRETTSLIDSEVKSISSSLTITMEQSRVVTSDTGSPIEQKKVTIDTGEPNLPTCETRVKKINYLRKRVDEYKEQPKIEKEKEGKLIENKNKRHIANLLELAIIYIEGLPESIATENDVEKGKELLQSACDYGDDKYGSANYQLGKFCFDEGFFETDKTKKNSLIMTAQRHFQNSANRANVEGNKNYGSMFYLKYLLLKPKSSYEVKFGELQKFVESHEDDKVKSKLKYYLGKFCDYGYLGEDKEVESEKYLDESSQNLADKDYRKHKSLLILGKRSYFAGKLQEAKNYFMNIAVKLKDIGGLWKHLFYLQRFHGETVPIDEKKLE